MPESLPILHHDEWFVAVHKPPGLFVHPTALDRREKKSALQLVRNAIGRRLYPVHRLDRPTSGVLLFALDSEAARQMARLFVNGECKKRYLAVVRGYIETRGVVDRPIKNIKHEKGRRGSNGSLGKITARTHFTRRATIELPFRVDKYSTSRYSLAELSPETGRRHQLRLHMKQISHPIIGDTAYCKSAHNQLFQQRFNVHRLLLAAFELSFRHPVTREPVTIAAPLDNAFKTIVDAFDWAPFLPDILKAS